MQLDIDSSAAVISASLSLSHSVPPDSHDSSEATDAGGQHSPEVPSRPESLRFWRQQQGSLEESKAGDP